ncbi:MAG: hypothetical protein IPO69_09010 [Saprospiraceae bacterium]|nr:hypothetical protein [Saprospiraceae bacterium]
MIGSHGVITGGGFGLLQKRFFKEKIDVIPSKITTNNIATQPRDGAGCSRKVYPSTQRLRSVIEVFG